MKKYVGALLGLAILPIVSVNAEPAKHNVNSSLDVKNDAETRTTTQRKTVVSGTRVKQSAPTVIEESRSVAVRKFFLSNPFFQPLEGRFGSLTDISYAHNSMNFNIMNVNIYKNDYETVLDSGTVDLSGKAETSQFMVTENIFIGLTDTLSLVGMAAYDSTRISLSNWSGSSLTQWNNVTGISSNSSSGVNVFGIGLQTRFIDSDKYIGFLRGMYKHEDNVNTISGEIKVGHKIKRTTIYGLVDLNYFDFTEGDMYGMVFNGHDGDQMILAYQTGVTSALYGEFGVGVFSVLNKYVTAKGELIYGSYDWHNQISMNLDLGYQPNDTISFDLYGTFALYDSAKGMKRTYGVWDFNPTDYPSEPMVYRVGQYEIDKYGEWRIGAQVSLYF